MHFQAERTAEQRAINANNLVRIVNEGHVLADHSYDHMYHNDQVLNLLYKHVYDYNIND